MRESKAERFVQQGSGRTDFEITVNDAVVVTVLEAFKDLRNALTGILGAGQRRNTNVRAASITGRDGSVDVPARCKMCGPQFRQRARHR